MEEHRRIFIDGAIKNNFDTKKAAELFDLMAYFAGYGFNKSHSTAYALIAYHTAYLKATFPKEFMSSLISFETNNPDNMTFYLQEISRMGIRTITPDINRSEIDFSAQEDGILFGLRGIKNLGLAALEYILLERTKKPFVDILDFCKRVDTRTVNSRIIESLIASGAMDSLPGNRAQKTNELDNIMAIAERLKESEKTGQLQLFSQPEDSFKEYSFRPCEEWKDKEKLTKEKELVGFYLSSHPLESHKKILELIKIDTFAQALERIKNFKGRNEPIAICCGLKQSVKEIRTKKGDRMAFAQFEDLSDSCEVIIFPRLYQKAQEILEEYNVFIIKGVLDATSDKKCKIKANELIPAEHFFELCKNPENCTIYLPKNLTQETIEEIGRTIRPGNTPLNISFYENGQRILLKTKKKISCSLEDLNVIKELGLIVKISP